MSTVLMLNIVGLGLNMLGAALLALDPIYGAGAKFQTRVRSTQLDNESALHDMLLRNAQASPNPPYSPAEIQKLVQDEESGIVDQGDVTAFLEGWAQDSLLADWNFDAAIDIRDVIEFLRAWAEGC